MPSAISHALIGACAGTAAANRAAPRRFWILCVLCASLPDVDVLAYAWGIPSGSFFGHRGFCHSLLFAFLTGCALAIFCFRQEASLLRRCWPYGIYFSLLIILHGTLDAFTNGGQGVAFFSPFDNARIFFPYTPIEVSPADPLAFFRNGRPAVILANEMLWIWAPVLTATLVIRAAMAVHRRMAAVRAVAACEDASPDG